MTAAPQSTLAIRFMIGLLQGATLYVLTEMLNTTNEPFLKTWPFTATMLTAILLPFILLASVGSMRMVTLTIWVLSIVGTIVAVSMHAHWLYPTLAAGVNTWLAFPLTIALFIGHHLIAAADLDRSLIARYPTYFDLGWRNGVQLALSLAFLGAFWLLLFLGASLFELINISAIRLIIEKPPFISLASCIVFALAVHISDARISLVTGARTIALILLSWLLPVMTLFALAFLVSLAFTGLAPLWATGHATAILSLSGAVLIVLINAAYQDGEEQSSPATILKWSVRLAALALVPITIIAFYSIWLRVEQYGLTPQRVLGLAIILLGACYSAGYAVAALWPGRWMHPLQWTNLVAATVAVALIVSLLTPLADPMRISVEDQVARLKSGQILPERFDFDFLKIDSGPYGRAALNALAADTTTPSARVIAAKATEAIQRKGRLTIATPTEIALTADELRKKIAVFPRGATLPENFLTQNWQASPTSPAQCARNPQADIGCQAIMADIDRDNRPEVLLRHTSYEVEVYRETAEQKWIAFGRFALSDCYFNNSDSFASGKFQIAPPSMNDLVVNGRRYPLIETCPEPVPVKP